MKKLFLLSLVAVAVCLFAIPAMADTQLLLNGGFESWSTNGVSGPPNNWFYRTVVPTVTADSTTVRSGNYSAKYYYNSTTTTKLASDTINVVAGRVYTCTLWVNDADTSGRIRPWFWFMPNGLNPSPAIPYSSNVAGWEALVWQATCPAGSNKLNMEIRGNSEGATRWDGDAAIYVDDFVAWEAIPTTNTPPVISSVLRYPYPLVPGGATVTSKATISDDHTIVKDSLYYRLVPAAFAPVTHDSIASGGNYWYTMGSYSIGDSVEYYIMAGDDSLARTISSTYGFTVVDTNTPVVPITTIQFNNTNPGGLAPDTCYPSPQMGNVVKIQGKVTAVYQQSGRHNWFWLQDADTAWSGTYIYGGTTGDTVQIGDSITVLCSVSEYYGLTELTGPTGMVKHATGRPMPPPVQVTSAQLGSTGCSPTAEKYEGVFMELQNFTITSYQGAPLYAYWGNDGSGDSCAIWTTIHLSGYDIPTYTIGQLYSSIKGVGYYTRGKYVLGPRVSADLVPANTPPSITGIAVYPSPMRPGQVVTLNATITTTGTIASDSLYYKLGAGAFTPVTHDSIATGNVYKFHMGSYAIGDSVTYYLAATDNIAQRTQTGNGYFIVPDTSFCGVDSIYNIQYTINGGVDSTCFPSSYDGQIVNICGVVTAVRQGTYKDVYMVDTRTPGGPSTNWTAITLFDFVAGTNDTLKANVGEKIEINGRVKEYYGLTEIDSLISYTVRGSGNAFDTTHVHVTDLRGTCNFGSEAYEEVLVKLDSVTVLSAKGTTGFWIKDNSSTDSIYMLNSLWSGGTDQPNPLPSTGTRYRTLVGVVRYEGRPAYTQGYYLLPRKAADYVTLVAVQANVTYGFPIDQTHLAVQFDRAMQAASANVPSHYTTNHGLSITAAVLDSTLRRVTLTTGAQTNGLADTLMVVGVIDSFGTTMINPDSTRIWQGFTPISTVQAPNAGGDTSAILNDIVTVKGVIVADTTSTLYNNLIINDASGYGCVLAPWTRTAIGWMPLIGDTVIVSGSVIEYFSETEISNFAIYHNTVLVNHGPAPAPTHKSSNAADFNFRQTIAGHETYEDVFSKLCDSLLVLPTGLPAPSDSAQLLVSLTSGDTVCLITKVKYHHYTAPVPGDTIIGLTGIFRWHFNFWRLEARSDADFNTGIDCGTTPPECEYLIGDISGDGQRLGGDVTYGVRYFKGVGAAPKDSCFMDSTSAYIYVAGDCNGNCEFRGSDITRLVAYFKGTAHLGCCHFFPTTLPPFIRPVGSDQGIIHDRSILGN
jgi:predicted extracellular nuclease